MPHRTAPNYFNVRKTSIYGGSNEIQRNIISKMVLGLFKSSKPSLSETMKQNQQAAKDAPVAVKGFKVGRFNYEDSMNVLGTIKGSTELKLSFEIPGVISSINYKEYI